jgi:hypothetical protein
MVWFTTFIDNGSWWLVDGRGVIHDNWIGTQHRAHQVDMVTK